MLRNRKRLSTVAISIALWALLAAPAPIAAFATAVDDGWKSNPSYSISFLGRDGPNTTDHYLVSVGWGASFFGIAVESMPLVPVQDAVTVLMDGFQTTYPDRPPEDLKPGDVFDLYVASGTLICTEWRQRGSAREFRSLRGDRLAIYTDPRSPISYRLARAENPDLAEIMVNHETELEPYELARALYGRDDPSFKPDFLQVLHANEVIENKTTLVDVDLARRHLDDFREIRESGEPGGKTEDGLDIYWFRSGQVAQPLFRVDDGIGDSTDPSAFPPLMRVYYYKDGVVRVYQRAGNTMFLRDRQPKNERWERVFSEYGGSQQAPERWDLGQPEQDQFAKRLNELGITVLRYRPKPARSSNFLTQLLDTLMALMNRES